MLRKLSGLAFVAGLVLLGLAYWPISGFCAGRPMGNDCETWFIFGVNMFGPIGLLALACSVWSLKTGSWIPHYALIVGTLVVLGYWGIFALQA
jgi:hypothetical protein